MHGKFIFHFKQRDRMYKYYNTKWKYICNTTHFNNACQDGWFDRTLNCSSTYFRSLTNCLPTTCLFRLVVSGRDVALVSLSWRTNPLNSWIPTPLSLFPIAVILISLNTRPCARQEHCSPCFVSLRVSLTCPVSTDGAVTRALEPAPLDRVRAVPLEWSYGIW